MELKDYLGIIRRRWLWALICAPTIWVVHFVFVSRQPLLYQASSRVIIQHERYDPYILSDVRAPSGYLQSVRTREATIREEAVYKIAAELLLGQRAWESKVFTSEPKRSEVLRYAEFFVSSRWNDLAGLVSYIAGRVSVASREGTQIVDISVRAEGFEAVAHAEDEALRRRVGIPAQAIADAMAEASYIFHRDQATAIVREQYEEVQRLLQLASGKLEGRARDLAAFASRNTVHSIEQRTARTVDRLADLEEQEARIEADRKKNLERIQFEMQQRVGARARYQDLYDSGEVTSPKLEGFRAKVLELNLQLHALLNGYPARTDVHPEVMAVRETIKKYQESIDEESVRLARGKGGDLSEKIIDLARENTLARVEKDLIRANREAKRNELQRLSEIRGEHLQLQRAFEQAQEQVSVYATTERKLSLLAEHTEGPVLVLAGAKMPTAPLHRQGEGLTTIVLSLLLGLTASLGVMYLVEYTDTTISTEYDIRRHLNLPLLGVITREGRSEILLTRAPLRSHVAEEFNTIATLIRATTRDKDTRSILVCSTNPKEGKTTISINLSVAMARKGLRTVLVDTDLRIPQVHNLLGLSNSVGISTLIEGRMGAAQDVEGLLAEGSGMRVEEFLQTCGVDNLRVLTTGPVSKDPVHLLESSHMQTLAHRLREDADCVFFDTPPISNIGDALSLASIVDGVVFVVGAGHSEQHEVSWTKHLLANVNANVIGVILNKASRRRSQEYYYYYSEDVKSLRRSEWS